MGSTITAAPIPIRLVIDAAKVKATTGSRQVPSSTVFSVTQRSPKPNSSARRATIPIVVSANGSGERCGNDMPRAVLYRNVTGICLLRYSDQLDLGAFESFVERDRQSPILVDAVGMPQLGMPYHTTPLEASGSCHRSKAA